MKMKKKISEIEKILKIKVNTGNLVRISQIKINPDIFIKKKIDRKRK